MAHTDHARPSRTWGGVWKRGKTYEAHTTRTYKERKRNLDMGEQLRDLGSERDYYTLATVGVHRPWPGAMALWECELLNHDTPWCCRAGSDVYATSRTPGYDVGFDVYYLDRAHTVTKIEPVIEEDKPMSALQRKWADEAARKAARKERKRKEALEARKRTLTDEERRAILRRESIGLLGFSRM